jgi:hypothetical protein
MKTHPKPPMPARAGTPWRRMAAIQAALALAALLLVPAHAALAQPCTRELIAAVIDETGAELRKLNAASMPAFQAKLRRLAEAKGWPETEIESRGAELLQDDETTALDDQASQLLIELDKLGDDSAGGQATCSNRLVQLKTVAAQLIEVTSAKAAHVSARLDAALAAKGIMASTPAPKPTEPRTVEGRPPAAQQTPSTEPKSAPTKPPAMSAGERKDVASTWETDTQRQLPYTTISPQQPGRPYAQPPPSTMPEASQHGPAGSDLEFTAEDISAAGRGFFGTASAGLASVIEYAFRSYGRPNGYILGTEAGGAMLAGLRYGEGKLVTRMGGERKVYWQGPSVGFDFGLAGSRVMFLVYHLKQPGDLLTRFAGIEGSAYVVGGVGITFLKKGSLIIAPIRTGLGLRIGANVGYLKFTAQPKINPF